MGEISEVIPLSFEAGWSTGITTWEIVGDSGSTLYEYQYMGVSSLSYCITWCMLLVIPSYDLGSHHGGILGIAQLSGCSRLALVFRAACAGAGDTALASAGLDLCLDWSGRVSYSLSQLISTYVSSDLDE